jgi:hypothetical protein
MIQILRVELSFHQKMFFEELVQTSANKGGVHIKGTPWLWFRPA